MERCNNLLPVLAEAKEICKNRKVCICWSLSNPTAFLLVLLQHFLSVILCVTRLVALVLHDLEVDIDIPRVSIIYFQWISTQALTQAQSLTKNYIYFMLFMSVTFYQLSFGSINANQQYYTIAYQQNKLCNRNAPHYFQEDAYNL